MHEQFDVLVVGAGPAGCAAAGLLATLGWRVLLLNRGEVPHPRLCTHAIMPAGLPVLRDLGVLDDVERAGAQCWWGVRLLVNGVDVHASLPGGRFGPSYGLSLRRHLLDPILLAAVQQQASAEVRLGWGANQLVWQDGAVVGVRARARDGETRLIHARLTVAADGRRSTLARAAGLPERRLPSRHAALIAYVDGIPREDRPRLEGFYDHGRSASLLPADSGLRVAGVMATADQWPRAEWPERMIAELRHYPGMAERLQDARLVTRPAPIRGLRNLLRRTARPGFAVIGDAALQTDPAFGQGIAWALRSGARLATAADRALRTEQAPACLPPHWAWERRALPLGAGISALSAIAPNSRIERLLGSASAALPVATSAALGMALRLV